MFRQNFHSDEFRKCNFIRRIALNFLPKQFSARKHVQTRVLSFNNNLVLRFYRTKVCITVAGAFRSNIFIILKCSTFRLLLQILCRKKYARTVYKTSRKIYIKITIRKLDFKFIKEFNSNLKVLRDKQVI